MRNLPILPLVIATALFMETMDSTIIATSLPAIAVDLKEDPILLKLALTSYLLSIAVFLPVSGWCADRFGARTVFRLAIGVFMAGSLACAFTNSLAGLVAARAFQGLGGAMMMPVGRLVLLRSTPKAELVRAWAFLSVPAMIGPICGPLVGGAITTYLHWRWIFWINIPIGLAGIVLASIHVPNLKEDETPPLDVAGFLMSGFGLAFFLFGLTLIGRHVVPEVAVWGLIAIGAGLLALYVRHARRIDNPILDMRLLAVPTFRTVAVGGLLFRVGIGSMPFLLPLMLQLSFGLSAFQSGALTFASAAGAFLMKFVAGRILRVLGFKRVLVVNALISAVFFAVTALFTETTPHLAILAVLLIGGFFRSLQFTSLNALAYADIDQKRMSRATSFQGVVQQLSGSIGIGIAALILEASQALRGGGPLAHGDFAIAFVTMAVLSGISGLIHARLPPDAGAELSGHGNERSPRG